MAERVCPGLPADWLNAWLAALGAITVAPELKLRWSDDPVPLAVLVAPGDQDPVDLLAAAWPTASDVASLPIARHLDGHLELTLNPEVGVWIDRAAAARRHPAGWTLAALFTDLARDGALGPWTVAKGQFHTPMPGRDNTVHDRLRKLLPLASSEKVPASLDGSADRVANYGLGFDLSRVASLADDTQQLVDPVVEVLAFWGLSLFPVRGSQSAVQRGWSRASGGGPVLRWLTWVSALDRSSVDALLDVDQSHRRLTRLGVNSMWEAVRFDPRGTSDVTRGFGSRRVEGPWDRR